MYEEHLDTANTSMAKLDAPVDMSLEITTYIKSTFTT